MSSCGLQWSNSSEVSNFPGLVDSFKKDDPETSFSLFLRSISLLWQLPSLSLPIPCPIDAGLISTIVCWFTLVVRFDLNLIKAFYVFLGVTSVFFVLKLRRNSMCYRRTLGTPNKIIFENSIETRFRCELPN